MTHAAEPANDRRHPVLTLAGYFFEGLVLLVFAPLLPFAPRYARHTLRTMGTIAIRAIDLPEQISTARQHSDRDATRVDEMTASLRERVQADDWSGVSKLLADVDTSRERLTHSDERLIDLALDFLRTELGEVVGGPNMCNFDYYFLIPDSMLARIEAASRARPDDPWLTALLAQVHIDRGWCARGGGWSHEVTEEGWHGLMNSFHTAYALLQRFDVEELRSPMYARVMFQLLATADAGNGLDQAREAYQNWSDLDVGNPLPHRIYAFFALPRWFGSWPSFDAEARAAAERTRHTLGKAAYAMFYLEAFEYDECDALHNLDVPTFIEALDELIRRDIDPVSQAVRAAVLLGEITEPEPVTLIGELIDLKANRKRDALRPMIRYIFETFVTHLPTEEGSEFEGRVLDQLVAVYAKELKAGLTPRFTADGMRLVPRGAPA